MKADTSTYSNLQVRSALISSIRMKSKKSSIYNHKIPIMNADQLKDRTKSFAADVARFCQIIHPNPLLKPYANQLIRASSSVGANYRAACRAKSGRDFLNKLKIVEEECDECMFFLELISMLNPDQRESITPIWREANEILSIIVSSIGTTRKSLNTKSKKF